MSKTCSKCKEVKPVESFYRRGTKGEEHRHRPDCKACHTKTTVRNYQRNPKVRRRSRLRRYGMTIDEYARRLAEQGGVCAICRQIGSYELEGCPLAVDHDHSTGAIRGLLCSECNRGLGVFKDSPDLLLTAAKYLMVNEGKVDEPLGCGPRLASSSLVVHPNTLGEVA